MSLSAILLVLASAAIHVAWNYIAKSSSDPRSFFALAGVPIVVLAIIMAFFIDVTALPASVLQLSLLSGVIHAAYFFSLGSAYANASVSLVYPIVRSAPALVPIGAFYVLGETITQRGVLGIGIVVASIIALGIQSGDGGNSAETSTLKLGLMWSFITLILVVGYTLTDKSAMRAFNNSAQLTDMLRGPTYFLLQGFVTYLLYWILTALRGVRPSDLPRSDWLKGIVAGLGVMASYSLILFVLQTEKVSYTVTLRQSSMVIATLVGWLVLKETGGRTRFLISIVLVIGLVLVATAE